MPDFFCAHVSNRAPNSAGTPWVWSAALPTAAAANAEAKRVIDGGLATLAFVCRQEGDGRWVVMGCKPESARKIVMHYEALIAGMARQGAVTRMGG